MSLNDEQRQILFDIVNDPRYTKESFIKSLPLCAELKKAVLTRGLVKKVNSAYGWSLPDDMTPKNAHQSLDIAYEIVLKPGYTLEKFLSAIEIGRKL